MVSVMNRLARQTALLLCLPAVGCICFSGTLNTTSPFLPPPSAQVSTADAAVLQYRGVYEIGGETYFNLADAATGKGEWVRLNQADARYLVKSREQAGSSETITVEYQGRSLRLSLLRPKTVKAALPSPAQLAASAKPIPPLPPGATRPADGPISPVVLNPTGADEQRRLEDFRAEYQRRRAQRQQAAQQNQSRQAPRSGR